MGISINITGLDPLKQKAKQAAKNLYNRPVPLGKSVIITTALIGAAQLMIMRRYKVSFLFSQK